MQVKQDGSKYTFSYTEKEVSRTGICTLDPGSRPARFVELFPESIQEIVSSSKFHLEKSNDTVVMKFSLAPSIDVSVHMTVETTDAPEIQQLRHRIYELENANRGYQWVNAPISKKQLAAFCRIQPDFIAKRDRASQPNLNQYDLYGLDEITAEYVAWCVWQGKIGTLYSHYLALVRNQFVVNDRDCRCAGIYGFEIYTAKWRTDMGGRTGACIVKDGCFIDVKVTHDKVKPDDLVMEIGDHDCTVRREFTPLTRAECAELGLD